MLDKGSASVTKEPRTPKGPRATRQVALTPSTFDMIRAFSRGSDATYDETLDFLLSLVPAIEEDPLLAGVEFRSRLGIKRANEAGDENADK